MVDGPTVDANVVVAPTPELLERLLVSRRRAMAATPGVSAAQFARSVNCADRTIRRYLAGGRLIPVSVLALWERACGLAPGSLTATGLPPDPTSDVVGRDRELRELLRLVHRSTGLRCAVLRGPSGIGKTTLAAALAHRAASTGSVVLWGSCSHDGMSAYDPILQALRPLGIDLGALLGENQGNPQQPSNEFGPHALHRAIANVLTQHKRTRTTLLVLDDVQLAATSMLQLIGHLISRSDDMALGIVAVVNTSEVGVSPLFDELVGSLTAAATSLTLDLAGLDDQAVATMLRASDHVDADAELAKTLATATGGNPLALHRELRLRSEAVSASSARVVDPIGVLRVAAAVGLTFDSGLVHDVVVRRRRGGAEVAPAAVTLALDEAAQAGIVEHVGGVNWRFVHQLYRREAYAQLSDEHRGAIHRFVLDALVDRSREVAVDPGVLAHHAGLASGVAGERKAVLYLNASHAAFVRFDLPGAAALASDGLAMVETLDAPALMADLLLSRARARFESEPDEARADAFRAAEAARTVGDPLRLAAAAEAAGDFVIVGQLNEAVESLCSEALNTLPTGADEQRSRLQAAWATNIIWSGSAQREDLLHADLLLHEAIASARRIGAVDVIERSLHTRCVALHGSPELDQRRAVADELEQLTGRPTWHRGLSSLAFGDRYLFEAQRRRMADSRHPWDQATAHLWTALSAFLDGRWDEVIPAADRAVELFPNNPNFRNSHAFRFIALMWEHGRLGEVIDAIEALLEMFPGLRPYHAAKAVAYWDLGRFEQASEFVHELARSLTHSAPDFGFPLVLAVVIEVGTLTGRTADVQLAAELLRPFSGQLIVVPAGSHVHGAADRFLGIAADTVGRGRLAADYFARAAVIEDRFAGTTLAPRTQLWSARGLAMSDDPTDRAEGVERLRNAAANADALSMVSAAALARHWLARSTAGDRASLSSAGGS